MLRLTLKNQNNDIGLQITDSFTEQMPSIVGEETGRLAFGGIGLHVFKAMISECLKEGEYDTVSSLFKYGSDIMELVAKARSRREIDKTIMPLVQAQMVRDKPKSRRKNAK